MIIEYHRPETLDMVLSLIARADPATYPMGGGTKLNRPCPQQIAVVDLQELVKGTETSLGQIKSTGKSLVIGGGVILGRLLDFPGLPEPVRMTLNREYNLNLRNKATVAGTLVSAGGRSGFATALMAADAKAILESLETKNFSITVSELLLKRETYFPGFLVMSVEISENVSLAYEFIARTPQDFPIVAAAVCRWASGRTRAVLSGYGETPLTVFDGPEPDGALTAAAEGYKNAEDEWASAQYRSTMAKTLVDRCLKKIAVGG
jgi:CO/xanthine dehydrogenase FAD-binding subunit